MASPKVISTMIDIQTADGVADAYVTQPDDGNHPGVLLFMDAIGLRPRIEDMADRIAGWGYVVLAPNLFYRSGPAADLAPHTDMMIPENREAFFGEAMARIKGLPQVKAVEDIRVYIDTLLALPDVIGDQIGITGYCMGGRLAFGTACAFPETVVAAGAFHAGGIVTGDEDSPHLKAGQARAELYFGHADNDRSMPAEAITQLEAVLGGAGLTYTSTVYEGAAHGYTMADTAMYNEQATEQHFNALKDLLARHL